MKLKEVGNMMAPRWRGLSRRSRENRRRKPVWEGVYDHYRDVPCSGRGFDDDFWVEETQRLTESLLATDSLCDFPEGVIEDHILLPTTVANLAKRTEVTSILDFGGGMGVSYITLRRSLPAETSLRHTIVECPRVCQIGTELFASDPAISFCESLPERSKAFDLVYICSALQYIENYAELLELLTAYRPRAILLAKTSAGEMPTFATAQVNVPGSSLPYWILNIGEIVDILGAAGYQLGCQGPLPRKYYQGNFPESFQFRLTRNLLFFRSDNSN